MKSNSTPSEKMPPAAEPPLTNVERCASYILQKIEAGEIGPDTRLGEPSLAKEIGMDRASVRTAFERLSATGILERKARSGTYLKRHSPDDLRCANEVRCQLEVLGARLAAANASKEEVGQLISMARLLDSLAENYANGQMSVWSSIRSLEIEFHTMIARFSHNPYLLMMMNRDSFLQLCFPFLMVSNSLKQEQVRHYLTGAVTNLDVAEAIESRDAERAAKVMTRHVEDSLVLYRKVLDDKKK